MSALLWHAILEAKRKGNQWFDFEGSMDPGVERFFRNFGARRELYMVLRKNRSLLWKLVEKLRR
jgi:lipid II:glycine glycyltransferase (peptidoglycan interpeptide bridge formation enzyme)